MRAVFDFLGMTEAEYAVWVTTPGLAKQQKIEAVAKEKNDADH